MRGTPWEPIPGQGEREVKSNVNIYNAPLHEAPRAAPEEVPQTRRVKITKRDVERWGLTPGCTGCINASRGGESKNHNEECRARMEECMKQSGHAAHAKAEERMNRRLAEHIEEQENKRQKVQAEAEQTGHEAKIV